MMKTYILCLDNECTRTGTVTEAQIDEFFTRLFWII